MWSRSTGAAASPPRTCSRPVSAKTCASFSRPPIRLSGTATAFYEDYTYLTEAGARYLVEQGVRIMGIDYLSVEQFKKPGAPAHRALLSNGVIIIEGLNLAEAEPGMYEMYCLPLPVTGGDGAPARVILKR